jgi:hypothetical protein
MQHLPFQFFFLPLAVQGTLLLLDEVIFHWKRGLGRWERLGHPLDTLSLFVCFVYALSTPLTERSQLLFFCLALFSCLFVTKDEWVHARECVAGEHWLHALLFCVHPLVLAGLYLAWQREERSWIEMAVVLLGTFFIYQILFWNVVRNRRWIENK